MLARNVKHQRPLLSTDFALWRLKNPSQLVCGSYLDAIFEEVTNPDDVSADEPPILFIHGVEYGSPMEVIRDLVQPFLASVCSKNSEQTPFQRTIYFVSWNSVLISQELRLQMQRQSKMVRAVSFVKEIRRWRGYFYDVERRAANAGLSLIPFVIEWCSQSRIGPTVVSHSLGAKVWADALNTIASQSTMLTRPGIWWNLQPALARHAFTRQGEYALVAQMYQGGGQAKAVTWYSRFDFILSTLFLFAKGKPALGQFGCPEHIMPQKDVTKWVGEAHGMNHISGQLGTFFHRAADQIADQARDLGIIA